MTTNINETRIDEIIEALLPVSRDAGKAILKIYESHDVGIEHKSDSSPLTKADLASNSIICAALTELSPDIPIISEENENIPYETRRTWNYCWVVDPLDGTKEFIKKNGEFTTNIGLVKGQEVIAGVVYLPVYDEMYYAIKGKGAYKISNGKREQLHAKKYSIRDKNLTVVCSRSHLDDNTKAFIERLDEPQMISKGSSLKFLSIAQGDAHIYPRMAPTMEWDTCAAQIILEEAGGKVLIHDSQNEPVRYNKEDLLNPYFMAKAQEIEQ